VLLWVVVADPAASGDAVWSAMNEWFVSVMVSR